MKNTLHQWLKWRTWFRSARLLIVDDQMEILDLFHRFFKQRGYRVSLAATIAEAEGILTREPFDLILQDVVLPDGDGIDFLPRIRALRPGIPVIVMTGLGYEEAIMQDAKKRHATSYVSKFLPLDQVLMEVHYALNPRKKSDGSDGAVDIPSLTVAHA